jgi:alpha/beta superfamily hydrolase
MPRRIESLFIPGPAGRLEALLEEPEEAPVHACLVCHPHPLYSGTMHNKVVYRIARGLRRTGAVVLRFNFRGVNLSEGAYDHGIGEQDDARAALQFLRERYPDLPYSLAGFSFGSRVILQLGCPAPEPRPQRLIAVGFPLNRYRFEYLADCSIPKHFVLSTNDEYSSVAQMEEVFVTFPEPKTLTLIEATDHFFDGGLQPLEDAIFGLAAQPVVDARVSS